MRADAFNNRQALLEGARRLMSDVGPDVSLTAIAAEAGVGIGTLYRHFPTREDLVTGIITDIREHVEALSKKALAEWDSNPEGSWRAFIDDVVALGLGGLAARADALNELGAQSALSDRERASGLASVGHVLGLARRDGFLCADLDDRRFVVGLASILRPLPQHIDADLPGQQQWLVDVYLRGLRP